MLIKKFFDIKRQIVILIGLFFLIVYSNNICIANAANYPKFTQELAENNLFNKYIEVLQTPSKAEAEVAKALQTGLKNNAPSFRPAGVFGSSRPAGVYRPAGVFGSCRDPSVKKR
jgi:hypothetical protein